MSAARLRSIFGAGLLCAALCLVFLSLGRWQWRVAFADQQRPSPPSSAPAVPLDQLSHAKQWLPRPSIGARVIAVGRFDDAHSFVTPPRPTSRGVLPWVVTPLRLQDGTVLAVVTGFTENAETRNTLTPIGAAQMSVTGRLQPSEDSPAVGEWQATPPLLRTPALVDRWPYPVVRDGYLVVNQSLTMNSIASPTPRFVSAPSGSIGWRSIAYACQWWSFAAFAVFVFIRQVANRPEPVADDTGQ